MILTTVIPTLNEKENIGPCIGSAKALPGEILVMDDSSDGTDTLARDLGARVVHRDFPDITSKRNMALDMALGDYVFFLDADERLSPKLASEIIAFLESGKRSACAMRRHNEAFGRKVRFGPLYPDWVTRLFPTKEVRWKGLIHERPVHSLPVVKLKGPMLHHTYPDFATYLRKQAFYAKLWAEEARDLGKTATPWKAVNRAYLSFLKMFFLKLGILGGPVGWALCWYYSSGYTLSKYLLLADKCRKAGELPKESEEPAEKEPKKDNI
ncbi:MAG: glycosyltransferase family 2 protein [Deltaproteobacteria bacterium]|jgi:glycosyltransferase involved in cell wall biosynthesis|nr:glycosyltransferase family 2 protein [Deltaproteobacteria bacterium]